MQHRRLQAGLDDNTGGGLQALLDYGQNEEADAEQDHQGQASHAPSGAQVADSVSHRLRFAHVQPCCSLSMQAMHVVSQTWMRSARGLAAAFIWPDSAYNGLPCCNMATHDAAGPCLLAACWLAARTSKIGWASFRCCQQKMSSCTQPWRSCVAGPPSSSIRGDYLHLLPGSTQPCSALPSLGAGVSRARPALIDLARRKDTSVSPPLAAAVSSTAETSISPACLTSCSKHAWSCCTARKGSHSAGCTPSRSGTP